MLSAAIASFSVSVFGAPAMARLRSRSRSAGFAAGAGGAKTTEPQSISAANSNRRALTPMALSSRSRLDVPRERADLPAHPLVAFVTVIARMPEQPQRKADLGEGLMNAHQPELPGKDRGERGRQRQQRVAVEREQEADQDRGNARGDPAGNALSEQ